MYTRIPKEKEENILRARGQESWVGTMLIGSSHSSSKGPTSLGSGKSCSIMSRRIGRASSVIIRWMDFSKIGVSNRKQHAEVSMLKRWNKYGRGKETGDDIKIIFLSVVRYLKEEGLHPFSLHDLIEDKWLFLRLHTNRFSCVPPPADDFPPQSSPADPQPSSTLGTRIHSLWHSL